MVEARKIMRESINQMFPGDGLELPTDDERDHADLLIDMWAKQWGEKSITIARRIDGYPTNRAYLRARLKRWFTHPTGTTTR